jgi:NAD(P)-dependent dehydrogenase (short-subunit alcohol dehydrogenase family)
MSQRVAIVTGAGRGIGAAIARQLNAAGMRVAAFDRTPGDDPDITYFRCDVTDTMAVDAAFTAVEERLGTPSVIVANAGIIRDTLLLRMSDDDWNQVIETNLGGVYRVIRRATRALMKERWGRIVVVSSVVALSGSPGQVNYGASKAGLIGLARSVAKELGSRGITCNAVAPGFIETDMTATLDDETRSACLRTIPVGRLGSVADVAAVVRFLTSDEAGYITGALIPVDGGMGMGH